LISVGAQVITKVWTDGQQGENDDYFADHCDGVTVTIGSMQSTTLSIGVRGNHFLTGFTVAEKKLLKTCLGDSDFDTANNQDVYNWDKGSIFYPHMIKLVRTVTTYSDGGYYAVIWFDIGNSWDNLAGVETGTFRLLNPFSSPDGYATDSYEVYTTKGTLALTSNYSEATFGFGSRTVYMTNITYDNLAAPNGGTFFKDFDGDISCEYGLNNAGKRKFLFHCLNKGDLFTLINWELPQSNPPHINLYTAERLIHTELLFSVDQRFRRAGIPAGDQTKPMHFMTHSITTDLSTNWAASVGAPGPSGTEGLGLANFRVYKFFPATASTYEYVAPCANRGICDNGAGTCQCFPGYTSDNCHVQASIAI